MGDCVLRHCPSPITAIVYIKYFAVSVMNQMNPSIPYLSVTFNLHQHPAHMHDARVHLRPLIKYNFRFRFYISDSRVDIINNCLILLHQSNPKFKVKK